MSNPIAIVLHIILQPHHANYGTMNLSRAVFITPFTALDPKIVSEHPPYGAGAFIASHANAYSGQYVHETPDEIANMLNAVIC